MAESVLGQVPSDWLVSTVGDVFKEFDGRIQTGPFGSQLHASDYVEVGVPTVMPTNIGDNRIIEEGISRIRSEDVERLKRHKLQAGDIVFSRRGDVERRSLVRDHEVGWLCGTGCLLVRPPRRHVDSVFLSHWFGHPVIRTWLTQHAIGATMLNLNTEILSSVPLVLPPLKEQLSIAGVLGALDDKIESNRRIRELLFCYIDGFCKSEQARDSMEVVELRSLLQFNYGKSLPKPAREPGRFPVVGSGGVDGFHASNFVLAPVVVVGRAGQPGRVHLVLEDCWPIDSAFWISPIRPLPVAWIWSALSSLDLSRLQSGSAVPGLNREIALSEKVMVPNQTALEMIQTVTDPMVTKIRKIDVETTLVVQLRNFLLPELLSGRLRVKDAESMMENV